MAEPIEKKAVENDPETIEDAIALYNSASRNYLLRKYDIAADEFSNVCSIYEKLKGPTCDELGMPYLFYAKCLINLAVNETKVLEVPDEEIENSDDDDDEFENNKNEQIAQPKKGNDVEGREAKSLNEEKNDMQIEKKEGSLNEEKNDTQVERNKKVAQECDTVNSSEIDCVPGTSTENEDQDGCEEEETASNLQIAWEILELAVKIFSKQGMQGLPNLADVHTELGNIEFENNIPEGAREDYEKALLIYKELPTMSYRRAIAEVHYKIGLTYLLQESAHEGIPSFKAACDILDDEINDIKSRNNVTQKDKDNIQDIEGMQQEILNKITDIEESKQQSMEIIRASLLATAPTQPTASSSSSSNTSNTTNTAKPTDISHLIKRKKPADPSSPSEETCVKRPAL